MIVNNIALKREIINIGVKLSASTVSDSATVEYDGTTQLPTYSDTEMYEFWADPQEATYQDIKNSGGLVTEKSLRLTVVKDCQIKQGDLIFYNGGTYETKLIKPKLNRKFAFIEEQDD